MTRRSFTQYVHEFKNAKGQIRYAVGDWSPTKGQYIRPFDNSEAELTGYTAEFARLPEGIQHYASRKRALRRARYLFYEMDKEYQDFLAELG